MINSSYTLNLFFIFFGVSFTALGEKDPRTAWIKLLNQPTEYVTWVSVVVKIEVSSNVEVFLQLKENWRHWVLF